MTSNNMTVCDEDLCNGPVGSGIKKVTLSVAVMLSIVSSMFAWKFTFEFPALGRY